MGVIAGQAAAILGVSTRTLAMWANAGKVRATRTPGGWRLYNLAEIRRLKRRRDRLRAPA